MGKFLVYFFYHVTGQVIGIKMELCYATVTIIKVIVTLQMWMYTKVLNSFKFIATCQLTKLNPAAITYNLS